MDPLKDGRASARSARLDAWMAWQWQWTCCVVHDWPTLRAFVVRSSLPQESAYAVDRVDPSCQGLRVELKMARLTRDRNMTDLTRATSQLAPR